jgi:protein SCO1/2
MTRSYAIASVALIAALLVGAGFAIWQGRATSGDDLFAECRSSAVVGGPGAIGGPFTLVSETGQTVTNTDVITEPALIYFGYTFCPDVCPLDAVRNAEAVDILEAEGQEVLPVFISIDPRRDTPEVLDAFTANVHPRMLGLTGSPEQFAAASQAYRTFYRAHDDEDDEFYLVDHSTFTYLVLPGHGFVEFFRRETTPVSMATTTACFIDAAS